jgi:hypothetical protein
MESRLKITIIVMKMGHKCKRGTAVGRNQWEGEG